MKRILLVAATDFELAPIQSALLDKNLSNQLQIDFLSTGIGMVSTALSTTQYFCQQRNPSFDLAINIGLAGAFKNPEIENYALSIGEVVRVVEDQLCELGSEDGENFIPMNQLFAETEITATEIIHSSFPSLAKLPRVASITVNTVHGNEQSIQRLLARIQPQVENMEGAAFFMACAKCSIPSIQLRAISNWVELRNRDNWNIPLALNNLKNTVLQLLTEIADDEN